MGSEASAQEREADASAWRRMCCDRFKDSVLPARSKKRPFHWPSLFFQPRSCHLGGQGRGGGTAIVSELPGATCRGRGPRIGCILSFSGLGNRLLASRAPSPTLAILQAANRKPSGSLTAFPLAPSIHHRPAHKVSRTTGRAKSTFPQPDPPTQLALSLPCPREDERARLDRGWQRKRPRPLQILEWQC